MTVIFKCWQIVNYSLSYQESQKDFTDKIKLSVGEMVTMEHLPLHLCRGLLWLIDPSDSTKPALHQNKSQEEHT